MYDPIETDISYEYMQKLNERCTGLRWALIGGWGVFLHVNNEYQSAFGRDYLKSRDIDIFIDVKDENDFLKIITELGFEKSAYDFRYELIYDREEKKILHPKESRNKHIFNLIYIFLNIFSNKKTKKLGSWFLSDLNCIKIEKINGYPILDIGSLLDLKLHSFFERERLDKELKDACDIYALLFYSGKKYAFNLMLKKAAEKIISRKDLQEYIAEQVLGDSLKSSLVMRNLQELIRKLQRKV